MVRLVGVLAARPCAVEDDAAIGVGMDLDQGLGGGVEDQSDPRQRARPGHMGPVASAHMRWPSLRSEADEVRSRSSPASHFR